MGKVFKLALILMFFCVVSAWALAYVYLFTGPQIDANAKRTLKNSLKEVLPQALSFNKVQYGSFEVYEGVQGRQKIGIIFPVSTKGYASNIQMLVGMSKNGEVSGIKILSQKETPGLGASIVELNFLNQFLGRTIDDKLEPKKDISAITGATISSRAVCNGVKQAIFSFDSLNKGGK